MRPVVLFVLFALMWCATPALAADTNSAPPSADATAAPVAAPIVASATAPVAAKQTKFETFFDQLRALRERLPFQLGAGMLLWYYQPLASDTSLAGGSLDGMFEVFFYYFKLDAESHGFGAHLETRMRDGGHVGAGSENVFFRDFYTSNIWLQEAYAFYSPGKILTLKAGKIYRRVGLFWDDSFFGNLLFYDGLKLNPDYGVSLEGEHAFAADRVGLSYAVQFFLNSDGINGGLDFDRTVGPAPTQGDLTAVRTYSPNPEGQLDPTGSHVGALRNIAAGRLVLALHPIKLLGIELGASGLTATVQRASTAYNINDQARMTSAVGDVSFTVGPVVLFGEYQRQFGPGVRDAHYVWAGVRGGYRRLSLRVNVSYVDYLLSPDVQEFIVQPGLTLRIHGGLSVMMEYNDWERKDPRLASAGGAAFSLYDRSLNTSLIFNY